MFSGQIQFHDLQNLPTFAYSNFSFWSSSTDSFNFPISGGARIGLFSEDDLAPPSVLPFYSFWSIYVHLFRRLLLVWWLSPPVPSKLKELISILQSNKMFRNSDRSFLCLSSSHSHLALIFRSLPNQSLSLAMVSQWQEPLLRSPPWSRSRRFGLS